MEGDLGRVMAMAEKADIWRSQGEGQNQKGQKQTKSQRVGTIGTGTKSKRKQKAMVEEEGFWEHSLGERDCDYRWIIQFWICCCGCLGANTQGHQNQNQQKKGPREELREEDTKQLVHHYCGYPLASLGASQCICRLY